MSSCLTCIRGWVSNKLVKIIQLTVLTNCWRLSLGCYESIEFLGDPDTRWMSMHSRVLIQVFTRKIEGRARDWRNPLTLFRPGRGETATVKKHGTPLICLSPTSLLWELFSVKEKSSYITIYRYLSSTHFFSQALCRAYTNEWDLILAFTEHHIVRNQDAHTMLCHDLGKCWGAQETERSHSFGGQGRPSFTCWCKCCDRHTKGGGVGRQFTQLDKTDPFIMWGQHVGETVACGLGTEELARC